MASQRYPQNGQPEPERSRPTVGGSGSDLVPEYCRKPILVLGCGNVLFGDDGFGPAVIEYLHTHFNIPDTVCAVDVGTGVRNVLFTISISPKLPRRILLIDAIDRGGSPGEIFELTPGDLPPEKTEGFSLHQAPSTNLVLELMSEGIDVRVLAAQTGHVPESVEPGLSSALEQAVPRMCERIVREYFGKVNT
jgi:coenzyme F420 hydrogenase subunit delta